MESGGGEREEDWKGRGKMLWPVAGDQWSVEEYGRTGNRKRPASGAVMEAKRCPLAGFAWCCTLPYRSVHLACFYTR